MIHDQRCKKCEKCKLEQLHRVFYWVLQKMSSYCFVLFCVSSMMIGGQYFCMCIKPQCMWCLKSLWFLEVYSETLYRLHIILELETEVCKERIRRTVWRDLYQVRLKCIPDLSDISRGTRLEDASKHARIWALLSQKKKHSFTSPWILLCIILQDFHSGNSIRSWEKAAFAERPAKPDNTEMWFSHYRRNVKI